MNNTKRILVLLLTVALLYSMLLPASAATSSTVKTGSAGEIIIVEYVYDGYAGINGTIKFSNPDIISAVDVTAPGLMGSYNSKTQKIAFFGMGVDSVTLKVQITIADNAPTDSTTKLDINYQLSDNSGKTIPYADETTVTIKVAPKLDYSVLVELIDKAKKLNEREYTAKSWDVLETALNNAIKAQNAQSQSEINSAASALRNAIDTLEKLPEVPTVDYTELLKQIKVAEKLNEKDYTAASWNNLKKALSTAKSAQTSTSQTTVDSAATALKNAIAALVPATVDPGVNYNELNKQIAIAEGLKEKDYTADSWAALDSAYLAAISARGSSNQTTVDNAAKALKNAISALVRVGSSIDYTELNKQIAIAEGLDETKYSKTSFAELTKVLESSKLALNAKTQEEVNTAAENLRKAIAELKEMQLRDLLAAIDAVKEHINNEKLAQLWKEMYEVMTRAEAALESGDQDEVDTCTVQLRTYLEAVTKALEEIKKAETVVIEKPIVTEPTDDYCNIPSHRVWNVLFWISLALNVALCGLIAFYFMRKKKTGDNTPLVDYDITDDAV